MSRDRTYQTLPAKPHFLTDFALYTTLDKKYDDALSDACKLMFDQKYKNLARGFIKIFNDDFIENLEIINTNMQDIRKRIANNAAREGDDTTLQGYYAELYQFGIVGIRDLCDVCNIKNPTTDAELVYVAMVYKLSKDKSTHQDWSLCKTFSTELMTKAHRILSVEHIIGDETDYNIVREKKVSDRICRMMFYVIQKFSLQRTRSIGKHAARESTHSINGKSPLMYENWSIDHVTDMSYLLKKEYVLDGLKSTLDTQQVTNRTLGSFDSHSTITNPVSTGGSTNADQRIHMQSNSDESAGAIERVTQIKNEFYDKIHATKTTIIDAKAVWGLLDNEKVKTIPDDYVNKMRDSVSQILDTYNYYVLHEDSLQTVKSPFHSVNLIKDNLSKYTIDSVLNSTLEQALLKTNIVDYYLEEDSEEYNTPNMGKRDMKTPARCIQEMIAGSDLCVGTKLVQAMKELEHVSFLSTPQPYYYDENKAVAKRTALKQFASSDNNPATVTYGIFAVHNINVDVVVPGVGFADEDDDNLTPVVSQKHLQRAILYLPAIPYTNKVTKSEKQKGTDLLKQHWSVIRDALNAYHENGHENGENTEPIICKNVMVSNNKLKLIEYFTGKSDTQRIRESAKKKRLRGSN